MFVINDRPIRNILVQSDHGMLIVNRFDYGPDGVGVGKFILDHGNNNTVEAQTTANALAGIDNPVIFDIGSNIGTYATWVAKWAATRNGKVYCFEPQRQVFQMLCGNLALNNIFNVYAYELALGKEEKMIEVNEVDYHNVGSFASFTLADIDLSEKYKSINNKQKIKLTTLDKFVRDYQIEKVDFIKIDAEGLDIDVMDGGINTIQTMKPDLYVEYLNLGPSKKEDTAEEGKARLIEYLTNLGYKCMVIHHDIFASCRDIFVTQNISNET